VALKDKSGFIERLTMGKVLSEMTLEELWDLFPRQQKPIRYMEKDTDKFKFVD
jgi:hypothetical protein